MQFNQVDVITIDRRSSVPIHEQIKESIKASILDQTLYYQSVMPLSDQLADALKIDVSFVHIAYQKLVEEGFLKKIDEQTYAVAYYELTNYFFYKNVAIYDAIKALGMIPSIECLKKEIVDLDEDKLRQMGFQPHEKCLYINRIYKGNDKPIIILENYLPLSIFTDIEHKFNGTEPLNAFMERAYGIKAKISRRMTKAVNLGEELAMHLGERKNAASIQSVNRVYDDKNRLIDFGCSHSTSSYYFQALITRDELVQYYQENPT